VVQPCPRSHSRARELLEFSEPVAVLLVAVLHFVGDQDKPHACVSALLDAVPAGSCWWSRT
jgi:hypothetical protein